MASNTGENDLSLRKITDMTRLISLLILGLHFYFFCYNAFDQWQLEVAPKCGTHFCTT